MSSIIMVTQDNDNDNYHACCGGGVIVTLASISALATEVGSSRNVRMGMEIGVGMR